jgi:hypothetical protein
MNVRDRRHLSGSLLVEKERYFRERRTALP